VQAYANDAPRKWVHGQGSQNGTAAPTQNKPEGSKELRSVLIHIFSLLLK